MSNKPTKLTVDGIYKLEEGSEVELTDFQITSVGKDDIPVMINMTKEAVEQDNHTLELKPGAWLLDVSSASHSLIPLPKDSDLTYFETATTKELKNHFSVFTKNLSIYKQLKIQPKRGILLGSEPGRGKSALINYFTRGLLKDKSIKGLSIIKVESERVNWQNMSKMLLSYKETDVSLLVLVLEDIGGTQLTERGTSVSGELLNFLDGGCTECKIPILVIGTTNFLDILGTTLTNRPSRFDVVLQVDPPSSEETINLVTSFLPKGYVISDSDRKLLTKHNFNPAYCKEVVVRHLLYDITLEESILQLIEQKAAAEKSKFVDKRDDVGFF